MTSPRFTPLVASLPSSVPFVGPETMERQRGAKFRARLGANENLFGPSPFAAAAMRQAAAECWMYCDPENHDLKHALASGGKLPIRFGERGSNRSFLLSVHDRSRKLGCASRPSRATPSSVSCIDT